MVGWEQRIFSVCCSCHARVMICFAQALTASCLTSWVRPPTRNEPLNCGGAAFEVPETSGDNSAEPKADASETVRIPGMMHRHRKMFQLGSRLGFMYWIHFIAPFTDTNKHTDRCSIRRSKDAGFCASVSVSFWHIFFLRSNLPISGTGLSWTLERCCFIFSGWDKISTSLTIMITFARHQA